MQTSFYGHPEQFGSILANAKEKCIPLEQAHWSIQHAQDLQIPYSNKHRASVPAPPLAQVLQRWGVRSQPAARRRNICPPTPALQLLPRYDQRDIWLCQNHPCHAVCRVTARPAEVCVHERLAKENRTLYSHRRMLKEIKIVATGT